MSDRREAVRALLANFGPWAIGDDFDLGRAVDSSDPQALRELVAGVDALPEAVWDWLAGPEAHAATPSAEYVAVSEITFAADLARVTLSRLPPSEA